MKIETLPLNALKPYSGNARTHSRRQIKQIARSIERFGFNNPILIDDEKQIETTFSPAPRAASPR